VAKGGKRKKKEEGVIALLVIKRTLIAFCSGAGEKKEGEAFRSKFGRGEIWPLGGSSSLIILKKVMGFKGSSCCGEKPRRAPMWGGKEKKGPGRWGKKSSK